MLSFMLDGQIVIALPDSLDRTSAAHLSELIETHLDKGHLRFIADAARLSYIDSFGISVLLRESKKVQAGGGEMRIRNLKGQPLDLVRFTGTDGFLVIEAEPNLSNASTRQSGGSKFEVKRSSESSVEILGLNGTLCFPSAVDVLRREFEEINGQDKRLLLDFSHLNYLDSVSVSELLSINHKLRRQGGSLRICSPNPIVRDILEAQNLRVIIPVFDTKLEALASWENIR